MLSLQIPEELGVRVRLWLAVESGVCIELGLWLKDTLFVLRRCSDLAAAARGRVAP